MTIHDPAPEDEHNSTETSDENSSGDSVVAPKPVNLQKRNYDLEATRYGDWELNGKCVDF